MSALSAGADERRVVGDQRMDYERYYPASPHRVFARLVGSLSRSGRLGSIEAHGSGVTFRTARSSCDPTRLLAASVQECRGGALLLVTQDDRGQGISADEHAEFVELLTLLNEVGSAFEIPGAACA